MGGRFESGRQGHDRIAMAFPDRLLEIGFFEQFVPTNKTNARFAVAAVALGVFDFAAEPVDQPLHAVADAEDRHRFTFGGEDREDFFRRLRRGLFVDPGRAAGEDDCSDRVGLKPLGRALGIEYYRTHAKLPECPFDNQGKLGAQIDYGQNRQ